MDRPAPAYRGGHTGRTPWLGLLFRAHFRTLCCYPRHNFAAAHPLGVVIRDTIFTLSGWSGAHSFPPRCCYPAHNFTRLFPPRFPWQSCYPAHILQPCSALPAVVIQHTFYAWKKCCCYRQHNSAVRDFGFLQFSLLLFCAHFTVCRISAGLLFAAQFAKKNDFTPVHCCYAKHNSKNLFSWVVICGTFYEKLYFSIPRCYGQHIFFVCRARLLSAAQFRSAGFLLPGLLNAAHFLQSSFSAPVL